jgi:hypothetical protein
MTEKTYLKRVDELLEKRFAEEKHKQTIEVLKKAFPDLMAICMDKFGVQIFLDDYPQYIELSIEGQNPFWGSHGIKIEITNLWPDHKDWKTPIYWREE